MQRANAPFSHLLPTLFDRLRDDAPAHDSESPSDYTATHARLREIVLRDLTCLLNTTNAEGLIDRRRHPDAAGSTLNYGLAPLAGGDASARRWADIERAVRSAILAYEPRLRPGTLEVLPLPPEAHRTADANVLHFEIRAQVDVQPYPLAFTVQSAVDLETRRVRVLRLAR